MVNIFELREVLNSYGMDDTLEYTVNDYQKVNHGQPSLFLGRERDGRIYAFVEGNDGCICLCEIQSKEQLIKLIEALLGR